MIPTDGTAPKEPRSVVRQADSEAVMALYETNVGLADRLARRYSTSNLLDEDLRQVAHVGLLLAARRFDEEKGRFLRFASMTIVGELKKHLRSHGWSVHVPRSLQEDSITVAGSVDRLTNSLGRNPRVSEIARETALSPERVADAMRVRHARFRKPLDHTGDDAGTTDDVSRTALLNTALDAIDSDHRRLIDMRFEQGLTQREIAEHFDVSQPEIHRRLGAALRELKHHLDDDRDGADPT